MLVADFLNREKFYVALKSFLAVPVLFNEKYPKMHEAAKLKLYSF
jgi:hypothetical protein